MSLLFLFACSNDEVQYQNYNGAPLKIAIVGDIPTVNTDKIEFETIPIEVVKEDISRISNDFDALFIMPVAFTEASKDQYVQMYKDLTIPTIFMNSEKRHFPFVNEGMDYETAPELDYPNYATAYLYTGGEENREDIWHFKLFNDKINDNNIQATYVEIFNMIQEH